MRALGPWLLLAALAGCDQDYTISGNFDGVGKGEPASLETPRVVDRIVQTNPLAVDVLWVVDNSCSMSDQQTTLANNFPMFLSWFLDSDLDWHIGVITTEATHPYRNVHGGKLVKASDGTRFLTPETLDADVKFRQMVRVGTDGWDEKGIEATYKAITMPTDAVRTANDGFLRDEAALHVIVVSDEDDFSPAKLKDELITLLTGLKSSDRIPVTFSSIVAHHPNGCHANDDGSRGQRYMDVTNAVGGNIFDLCASDWSPYLDQLGLEASGRKDEFFLTEVPVPGTIEVTVERKRARRFGIDLDYKPEKPTIEELCERRHGPKARCFPFRYDPVRNSVVFPEWLPGPLDTVVVEYELLSGLQSSSSTSSGGDDTDE